MSTSKDNIDLTYLRTSVDDKNKNIKNSSGITKFIVRIHTKYAYTVYSRINEVHTTAYSTLIILVSIAVCLVLKLESAADAILFQAE